MPGALDTSNLTQMDEDEPQSPTMEMTKNLPPAPPGMVSFVCDRFLGQKQYSKLHAALSTAWNACHSLTAAMKLMEQYGVQLTPDEEQQLLQMDEASMIEALVMRLPTQTKEQFEEFFHQLQLIVSTATRIRAALESGSVEETMGALNDVSKTGIAPYVLKMAIVQAGSEVSSLKTSNVQWVKDSAGRMRHLLSGADDAFSAKKQLADAQKQLSQYSSSHNDKAKKMMMGVAGNQDKALKAACFLAWADVKKKLAFENKIRAEYEERIDAAQKRLFDYKQSQKGNAKGVLMKQAAKGDSALVAEVYFLIKKELEDKKLEEETQKKMKEMEAKLKAQSDKNKENTKSVLMRNLAAGDNMLMDCCLEAWKSWLADYKKNKDEEDAIKAAEQKMNEFMKGKNEGAKGIIDRMNSATDSGLCEHVMSTWAQYWKDLMEAQKMEELLNGGSAKMGAFNERNKGGAMTAGQKADKAQKHGLILHAFVLWQCETKMERTLRYYTTRVEGRKHQIENIQTIFSSFANQLEKGIKDGTPRQVPKKEGERKLSKTDQTASLPNIEQKKGPGSGSRGNGSSRKLSATAPTQG